MKQILKREMSECKRIQDFCHTHPAFLYTGVPIRRAALPLGKVHGCALTFNLTVYKQQLRNDSAWVLIHLSIFKNFPSEMHLLWETHTYEYLQS